MLRGLIGKLLESGGGEERTENHAERIQVATCVLLLEMAHTDGEFSDMEELLVRDLLQKRFGLSEEATAELLELSQHEREESLDLYQFGRYIHENFPLAEKLEILEALWRIVYADGVLDKYEDYLMRKLTTVLRLSHKQMIDAKVKVLEDLESPS
ncbi:MAG: TerB family tellurite resistance protein [Desulfuromonadales bacterium]|nr:TerB family tellurite resistance protein [Desulfuromonadales bacterium]NIR33457.1 TerB family tellurite resistance protein [Desulfuromonadales bacterium]NIS42215.1 TerB family tellurite resistance protein [Desulfuromonadales bacterium]